MLRVVFIVDPKTIFVDFLCLKQTDTYLHTELFIAY